ncbi:SANTA domain-containing protein [Cephalotus follicularis]|uniref:SANTA domain-containing protein n=1 Tax=Cephalotus follicularis TaxID=3775 RepID=A0A1Q3B3V1_CEPFO|nr:SANTA domain-containing protein [Cephalotus follicularis]
MSNNKDNNNGNNINESYDGSSSIFQKTVSLQDWWLSKAVNDFGEKQLAVAGFTSRELQLPVRLFTSAPIVKRYDVFTLETSDGICVRLNGFMNKSRARENGFPSEASKYFVFGFPIYWETCAEKFLVEECSTVIESENASGVSKSTKDSASAGMRDSVPSLTPYRNEVKSDDKHDVTKDIPCNVSEKIAVDTLKGCNLHNFVSHLSSYFNRKPIVSKGCFGNNDDPKGKVENNHTMLQNECENSVAVSPKKSTVDIEKTSASVSPLLGCHVNDVSLLVENLAVPDEPLRDCVTKLSVGMDTQESSRVGKQRSVVQSNIKGSANIERSTLVMSGKYVNSVQSGEESNHSYPFAVNTDSEYGTPIYSGTRKSTYSLRNRNDKWKQNGCLVKHRKKESAPEAFGHPDEEQLKGSLSHGPIYIGKEMDSSKANPSESEGGIAKSSSKNLKRKEMKKQVAVCQECSPGTKIKRKVSFDTHATPLTEGRKEKESTASPVSMGSKRSRSGRLLVPTLDFWRNQIPVYDAERNLIGIQEGLSTAVEPSRGSRSEASEKAKEKSRVPVKHLAFPVEQK